MLFRRARPRLLGGVWGFLIKAVLVVLCLRALLTVVGALAALAVSLVLSIVVGAVLWVAVRRAWAWWRTRADGPPHERGRAGWRDPMTTEATEATDEPPAEPWAQPAWTPNPAAATRRTLPPWLDRLGGWLLGHPWGTTWTEARAHVATGRPLARSAYHPQHAPEPRIRPTYGPPLRPTPRPTLPALTKAETAHVIDTLLAETRQRR